MDFVRGDAQAKTAESLVTMAFAHVYAVRLRIRVYHKNRFCVTANAQALSLADGIELRPFVPTHDSTERILLVAGLFHVVFPTAVGFGFKGDGIADRHGQAL